MGDKSASTRIMGAAGVPLVPGYHGKDQDVDLMKIEADKIGYPILIKLTHGDGGKSPDEFVEAFLGAQREAAASFGINTILLEKYITQPRHIEVQIFGDKHGNVLHLYERDCSGQRRHQKIIEDPTQSSGQRRHQKIIEEQWLLFIVLLANICVIIFIFCSLVHFRTRPRIIS